MLNGFLRTQEKVPDETQFNLSYQILSLFLDFILITIIMGVIFAPITYFSGGGNWIAYYIMSGFYFPYYVTKRMKDGTVAGILYGLILFFVISKISSPTNYLDELQRGNLFLNYLLFIAEIAVLKSIFEVFLVKLGFEIRYSTIEWLKEKLAS